MAQTGLTDRIVIAVQHIARGRIGFATDGKEHEGRIHPQRDRLQGFMRCGGRRINKGKGVDFVLLAQIPKLCAIWPKCLKNIDKITKRQ